MQLGHFEGALDVRLINCDDNAGRGTWELLAPLTYHSAAGQAYTVPAGFRTDFMSVPPEVPGVVSLSRSRKAGATHDFFYTKQANGEHPIQTRIAADQLLREMYLADVIQSGAKDDEALRLEADAVFAGVRLGGASHWD